MITVKSPAFARPPPPPPQRLNIDRCIKSDLLQLTCVCSVSLSDWEVVEGAPWKAWKNF